MKNNGSDIPVFETDEDRSYFLTILPIHPLFTKQSKKIIDVHTNNISTRRNRDELWLLIRKLLNENGDMSANEIASTLGYKKLTDTLRAIVNTKIDEGEISYLYPDKPKSRNQKIVLNK